VGIPPEQAETAALLQRLSGAAPVETHISLVFVGADTVWKLKKSVRLPFLDFSAVAARRHFAFRELALNGPAAPGLYRDVVPVRRSPGGELALGDGPGEPVDWVLRMAPVPPDDFLDAIAASGRLDPSLQDALADAVAAYHQALPPVHGVQPPMEEVARGNVRSGQAAGLPQARVEAWGERALARLAEIEEWLTTRATAGFVRRAHGDLHLGNLCLWRGKPAPFDALEFDEALAIIDLAYDFAFLLMDLDLRVGRPAANRVLNRYVARTGGAGLVRSLPCFLTLRAMIRAHVEAQKGATEAGERYLSAAEAYLDYSPARAVAIGGLPASGKSTLARCLAPGLLPAPGALVLRSDEIRKRQHGAAPEQRLPAEAYSEAASRAVMRELAAKTKEALASGHSVIADATFMDLTDRDLLAAAVGETGMVLTGFWLEAPLSVLEERIARRTNDASDATLGVLRSAAAANPGPGQWHQLDTSDTTNLLARTQALLCKPQTC
jgi:aminoglycoside phosphotransferase family enzyme/predicted kinase